jgi:large subunit ribosomal protein L4
MTTLKKFDIKGKETGVETLQEGLVDPKVSNQSVKDYIVALRQNARQWSASTKDKSEVKATGKKPHPQKGTGRARQGSLVSPQFRGGGVVFGPKPKFDQHVRINRKEKRAAMRSLVSKKIEDGTVLVLDAKDFKAPRTKDLAAFLETLGLNGKRVLFLGQPDEACPNIAKSSRNLKKIQYRMAKSISGYDLMLHPNIIVLSNAMEDFVSILRRSA